MAGRGEGEGRTGEPRGTRQPGTRQRASARRVVVAAVVLVGVVVAGSAGQVGVAGAASVPIPAPAVLSAAQEQMVPARVGQSSLSVAPPQPVVLPRPVVASGGVGPVTSAGVVAAPVFAGASRDPKLDSAYGYGYRLSSGVPMVVEYLQPVNYQSSAGVWTQINPALHPDGQGGFENSAAAFQLDFPSSWSAASPITFSQGGVGMTWSVVGMQPATGSAVGQVISYQDVLAGTSITYTSTTNGVGEVVSYANVAAAGAGVSYQVQVSGGGQLVSGQNGSLELEDASGTVVSVIPAPVATDSSVNLATGAGSTGNASWQVANGTSAGSYQVTLQIDPIWLASATYPVLVDPGNQLNEDESMDSFVDDAYPGTPMATDPSQEDYLKVKDQLPGRVLMCSAQTSCFRSGGS